MVLTGISRGFAGMHSPTSSFATGTTADDYYGNDIRVQVGKREVLHIIRDNEKCRLTLFLPGGISGTGAIKLESVTLNAMKEAVKTGEPLKVGLREFKIPDSRALKKLLD